MANTNVAKKAEAKLPALSLDMMEADAHSGLENIHQDDLATPRLKIRWPLNTIGEPVINSCSLAKATIDPVKVIAPITIPILISILLISRMSPSTAILNISGANNADAATNTAARPTKL